MHRPPPDAKLELLATGKHPAQRRLAFEELLAQHLSLRLLRHQVQRDASWPLASSADAIQRFLGALPFSLTNAQARVWREIEADLKQRHPMLRLVQGDVGCGKTIVAALAAARAVECGLQAAIMAPTELLAEQHARNFAKWFEHSATPMVLLSGRATGKARATSLADLECGDASIAIGTHALFQEGVKFRRLGLVIIDEQHRFGVHQRLLLREKGLADGRYPHQLIMTATPIPRTLAMTAYADLDVSVIDELPPGRTPVKTVALPEARRSDVVMRIRDACRQKRQAYWVCPLIEESELLNAQAAEQTVTALTEALPDLRIGLVHGRMSSVQKDAVMSEFKANSIDLLVATTVIEVGVDVPNASVMVIEHAERFGLAQLHQLRGRIGRGAAKSYCVLMTGGKVTEEGQRRLQAMVDTNDGFKIAELDLELRGPGEFFGTRQAGLPDFRVANIIRDAQLLEAAKREAAAVIAGPNPEISSAEISRALVEMRARWQHTYGLVEVG
jgi:ATP-dependent DNA helicase RecG